MDTKNTQQKEFDTALSGLTPEQRTAYTKANPTVGVGGVQQTATSSGSYIPTTISLSDLNGNVQPYNLPKQQTQPIPQGLQSVTGSVLSGIKTDANQTIPAPTQPPVKEETGITKYMKENFPTVAKAFSTQAQDILALQQDPELLKKKERATAVSNEIDALDKQFRDEVAQIKTNPEGKWGGAIQSDIARAQERYENRRANIALTYKVLAGDYNAAQEIVNQKVQALKDTNAMQLEQFKLGADAIRNDLSESEKITLSETIKEKERKANDLSTAYENTLKALQSSGQNVPSYVYDNVDAAMRKPNATAADLYKAAGNYATNLVDQAYKKAQTDKLIADTPYANNKQVVDSPIVSAMINVNAGSAEGQQKRDAALVAQYVASGQTDKAKQLVLSRVTSKMSATERDAELDRRNTIDALSEMKAVLNDYVATTGDTNILTGNIENLANKIGQTSDPRLAALKTRITQATQKYRNAITGAAWGDQETAEYKTLFPSISNSNKLNSTIIDTMIPLLQNNERNAIGLFLGGSDVYDSVFGEVSKSDAKTKVIELGKTNPTLQTQIKQMMSTPDPVLGRPLDYDEVLQVLNSK